MHENIEFVIVGGFAGVLHGSSMVTQDLDLCFPPSPTTIMKLRSVFKNLHPTHRMTPTRISFLESPADLSQISHLYLETDLGVVDFLGSITGVGPYERVAQAAQTIEIFGRTCKVMSLDDLITAKEAIGRPKDIAMVKELRLLQEKIRAR